MAFQRALNKFGILELVRTGRIALKRGESLFKGNTWTAGQASPSPAPAAAPSLASKDGVYGGSSDEDDHGVWAVHNILDAVYHPENAGFEPYTLSIDVEDVPGVLNQVTGVISRRGFNIQSLAVGNSEREGMSRITLVIPGDDASISKLVKQLLKLIYVGGVKEVGSVPHVSRELMLVKVKCLPSQRGELMDVARIFHGSICDVSKSTVSMEIVGKERKMRAIQEVLEPYGESESVVVVSFGGRGLLFTEFCAFGGHYSRFFFFFTTY